MFRLTMCVHFFFFFFNDTATTEIYTLSLHDALPICGGLGEPDNAVARGPRPRRASARPRRDACEEAPPQRQRRVDRKSTRLNSSHANISYAVFCLKKKKNKIPIVNNLMSPVLVSLQC